jgi:primosomal protein N' (replication factor Y) (superfamily II helicase)
MVRVVRVMIDEPAVEREFDYSVPDSFDAHVRVGTPVRVPLHGRRVGGWVVADHVDPPAGVSLLPVARSGGWGPEPELIELARWAGWRWAGRAPHFLRAASPAVRSTGLPAAKRTAPPALDGDLLSDATAGTPLVLQLPPGADRVGVVFSAASRGQTLVIAPSHAHVARIAAALGKAGVSTAVLPREWAAARAGRQIVIGARAAAWGPAPDLAAVVVLEEHEEVHQEEASPTWHARDVAVERARRAGALCVLVSSCPSLEARAVGNVVRPERGAERAGWPIVEVVDRGRDDPTRRRDLYTDRLVDLVRGGGRVVCVLNRKGRARLLDCRACGALARCERCDAAVAESADKVSLHCPRCGAARPHVCLACGATSFRQNRIGTTRAREDLERLTGLPVGEVTGDSDELPDARVLVGTEAVLRRIDDADAVAFLDLDAELLAPRYRAAEEAMSLIARAATIVGGRDQGGRLLLQTSLPRHEVVLAAVHADPDRVAEAEASRREALGWPPFKAMAHISGVAAPDYVDALKANTTLEILGPADSSWLIRAHDHETLCDALAATPRPPGRLRVAVDPLRV